MRVGWDRVAVFYVFGFCYLYFVKLDYVRVYLRREFSSCLVVWVYGFGVTVVRVLCGCSGFS